MNINVATKIIGGFVITSVLILVISASALLNLRAIDAATNEVTKVTIPVLDTSSSLKASFLNMGRVAFEAFIENSLKGLDEKNQAYNTSKVSFGGDLETLNSVASGDAELNEKIENIRSAYQNYTSNVNEMINSRRSYLTLSNQIEDVLEELEANADDASMLILDFADMDEVADNSDLNSSVEIGGELESSLLTLMTVADDFVKTDTILRAETVGQEIDLVAKQIVELKNQMITAANDSDTTGTLEEIEELVSEAANAVTDTGALVDLHIKKLKARNKAKSALEASDTNSQQGIVELESLLGLADGKVQSVEKRISSTVSKGNTQTIIVVVISLIVASIIGYLCVISISRPIARVNALLETASSGDLTQKLNDSANDEFGVLSKNCNKLINSLKLLINGINERAEQLAAASEQTSAVTTQTTTAIQNQKSQIAQAATATTEMHSTSQAVTKSAEDTLAQITNADKQAQHVREISLQNKQTIEVLARDVEEAASVINKLHEDSASIGGILDVIRGVADQTNLLALNAAIEAARAGEQGRGFAVVADEVRTLASRTQESTQEINAMIEVLQSGAEKAVSVMNQGKEQTNVCVEQTEKATLSLDDISSAVRKAHDVSTQIEQSAREQNLVSQEISENLESIVGIAEETTVGAQQTSDSSHEVARLAEELQQSIRKFKV